MNVHLNNDPELIHIQHPLTKETIDYGSSIKQDHTESETTQRLNKAGMR